MFILLAFWLVALGKIYQFVWNIVWDIYVFLLAPRLGRCINLKLAGGGSWAVVTGGGAGIGRGYALALASKGIHVCLIGRTESHLRDVGNMCEEKYKVKTKVIVHDFSNLHESDAQKLKEALRDIFDDIGILINNVGIMGGDDNFMTPFINNTPNPIDYGRTMVTVNIQSMILMTGLLLPLFVKRTKGIVVNVGSSSGFQPVTGHAIYSSTKVFNEYFTHALRQEVENSRGSSNVLIQTVNPFSVRTALIPKLAFDHLPSLLAPTPERFALDAVSSIGLQERTCGCLSHNIQRYGVMLMNALLPDRLQNRIRYNAMVKFKSPVSMSIPAAQVTRKQQ